MQVPKKFQEVASSFCDVVGQATVQVWYVPGSVKAVLVVVQCRSAFSFLMSALYCTGRIRLKKPYSPINLNSVYQRKKLFVTNLI